MLPRKNHLTRQKDFKNIFSRGRTVRGDLLILKSKPNGCPFSRFGLVISSTVAKKATIRNHLRRQLSEIIRHRLSNIKSGVDVVFIAKPALAGKPLQGIEAETTFLLKKAGLFI